MAAPGSGSAAIAIGQDLIRACKVLDGIGLVQGFGHISARLPDGCMLITPARGIGLVREEQLLVFNLDGQCVSGEESTAPLERWLHFATYQARPDVNAICRTHSLMAVVMGTTRTPIRAAHGFGGMLGMEVPVHDETDLITNNDMGRAVAAALGGNTAILLRGNGALITGGTLPQACIRAIYLEEAAWLQVVAVSAGGAIKFTVGELSARARWYDVEVARAWEYYTTKFAS